MGSVVVLDAADVGGAGPLRAVDDLEPHLVALVQLPEALGPDLGVVNENVRPTLAREETEALGLIESLDVTFDHERTGLLAFAYSHVTYASTKEDAATMAA